MPRRRTPLAARLIAQLAATATAATTAVAVSAGALAPPAHAAPVSDHEMPFPCAQQWTGTTRTRHSPSVHAIDWNRADDLGDPVVASSPGTVTTATTTSSGGYGKYVVLGHGAGESTVHAHLSGLTVRLGQRVDQGSVIGYVGSTGNSSGPHLHYEQRLDRRVQPAWFSGAAFRYGTAVSRNCLDVPLAANMVGDAQAERIVFRRRQVARFLVQRPDRNPLVLRLGSATDEPVLGDWDGSGRANPGVRSPATSEFLLRTPSGLTRIRFGVASDRPVAGDWDGDGRWEVGVHRAGSGRFLLRAADGRVTTVSLGDADDLPLTGDWNGDGRTDLAVFDSATAVFTLRYGDDDLVWTAQVRYGAAGDLPVAGDWNGNGRTDIGVWQPATATFSQRVAKAPTARYARTTSARFGRPR